MYENQLNNNSDHFDLLPENLEALNIFQMCRHQRIISSSMAGSIVIYDGIEAQEIESVMNTFSIKRKERPDLLLKIRKIEEGAKEEANKTK